MASDELPDAVRRLISDSIDSVPELEAILLLREHGQQQWTAAEAGQRLYVSTTMAAHVLAVLADRGFFQRSGDAYRYLPRSTTMAAAVEQLADSYARSLIAVTRAIHTKPSASVRLFADAFRLRKDD